LAFGWRGARLGPNRERRASPGRVELAARAQTWLTQAGLDEIGPVEFAIVLGGLLLAGTVGGLLVFGAPLPALAVGVFAASFPVASYRRRREQRRRRAQEAWPRLIDQIRVLTGSAGRSIPQALFEAGAGSPAELRPAFAAAHREWLLSTDFTATLAVLEEHLADPVADVACETLLVAHQVGGTDLERRLEDLAADRRADVHDCKDAVARQAGVRFARRFVLVVPAGMALVGLSVGTGRDAYQTPAGQLAVVVSLGMIAACWVWSGRVMRLPAERRILR
jgi:tight adherence protein B